MGDCENLGILEIESCIGRRENCVKKWMKGKSNF